MSDNAGSEKETSSGGKKENPFSFFSFSDKPGASSTNNRSAASTSTKQSTNQTGVEASSKHPTPVPAPPTSTTHSKLSNISFSPNSTSPPPLPLLIHSTSEDPLRVMRHKVIHKKREMEKTERIIKDMENELLGIVQTREQRAKLEVEMLEKELLQLRTACESEETQITNLKAKKERLSRQEADEARQLEHFVEEVESNLELMASRAKKANKRVAELQSFLVEEQKRLNALRVSYSRATLPVVDYKKWRLEDEDEKDEEALLEGVMSRVINEASSLGENIDEVTKRTEEHLSLLARDLQALQELSLFAHSFGSIVGVPRSSLRKVD